MVRTGLGIVVGAIGWLLIVTAISFALRASDPALAAILNAHATTMALAGRLVISFAASLAAGALAGLIGGWRAALVAGVLLLAGWGYYHVAMIWNQFPVWYHLTFFVSLPLLSLVGARLVGAKAAS